MRPLVFAAGSGASARFIFALMFISVAFASSGENRLIAEQILADRNATGVELSISLERTAGAQGAPATIAFTVLFDPHVVRPSRVAPNIVALNDLVITWYNKFYSSGNTTDRRMDIVISGGVTEITTIDDQRGVESTGEQINPLPLATLYFDVVGEPGESSPITLANVSMADAAAAYLADAAVTNGMVTVRQGEGGTQVGVSGEFNVLSLRNTFAPQGSTVAVPLYLEREPYADEAPSAMSFTLKYDESVLAPVSPYFNAASLLGTWYGKTALANDYQPGEVRFVIYGLNQYEITTFDNQRPGGTPTDQQNPFFLGEFLFTVISAEGSSLEFEDVTLATGAATEVRKVRAVDAYFNEDLDTDGDGMPDNWEIEHGLNPNDPSDAGDDDDDDLFTNIEEFRAQSNPKDSNSRPLTNRTYYVSVTGSDFGTGAQDNPWRTISHAMTVVAGQAATQSVTIVARAGTYEERVLFSPNVQLLGEGRDQTVIRYYNAADSNHDVVTAADGTALRNCTVGLPAGVSIENLTVLVRVENVRMDIQNVILDGGGELLTYGVLLTGVSSSGSTIQDCLIKRVQFGVQAVNSGVTMARNTFEDISTVGVLVKQAAAKQLPIAPLMGDINKLDRTGLNRFRNVEGLFVQSFNTALTLGEVNDWGLYTRAEIDPRITGNVDFEPFIGKSLLPGSLAVTVLDRATNSLMPGDAPVTVEVTDLNLMGERDESSGVYVFAALPAGQHFVNARVTGGGQAGANVDIAAGEPKSVVFALDRTGGATALIVTPLTQTVDWIAGQTSLDVSFTGAAVAWTAEVMAGAEWASITTAGGKANGVITVTCEENRNPNARPAQIRITADGAAGSPVTAEVIQSAPTDISGDGDTDAQDVQMAINAALDIQPIDPRADVNRDSFYTSVDVQIVILGALDAPLPPMAFAVAR